MRIVVIILFVTAALTLLACSSESTPTATVPNEQSQPSPDLDATVEAWIAATMEAERSIEATVTSRVEATKEAEPTSTPEPTPTPEPTSTPESHTHALHRQAQLTHP